MRPQLEDDYPLRKKQQDLRSDVFGVRASDEFDYLVLDECDLTVTNATILALACLSHTDCYKSE